MAGAVAVALVAAVAFGWSTALMHHSASGAPDHVDGIGDLLRHVTTQWRWLLGMLASLVGLVLHTWALHLGSIALVQPLVVSALVFAFIFREALDRTLPSRRVMGWVLLTALGLVLFVVAASSTKASGRTDGVAATVLLAGGAAIALVVSLAARSASPSRAGLLLGVGAGVVFGLIAGVLKALTNAAEAGHVFSSWPLYVLPPLGAAAFLLNQRAYHQAPLTKSLPVLNTVNPLVALAFGLIVFHERPTLEFLPLLTEVVGLASVLAGIFFLARSDEVVAAV